MFLVVDTLLAVVLASRNRGATAVWIYELPPRRSFLTFLWSVQAVWALRLG